MFKRKSKCQHDWKILDWTIRYEGDGNWHWEKYHPVTDIRGFCKSCGITSSWNIAKWRMSEEQVSEYVREVYGQ